MLTAIIKTKKTGRYIDQCEPNMLNDPLAFFGCEVVWVGGVVARSTGLKACWLSREDSRLCWASRFFC